MLLFYNAKLMIFAFIMLLIVVCFYRHNHVPEKVHWKRKKHKAHISKYVPFILKYMACIFNYMPYIFSTFKCRKKIPPIHN